MANILIHINGVDGSYYGMGCDDRARVLRFLEQYDHEGSTLQLDLPDENMDDPEAIYAYLRT